MMDELSEGFMLLGETTTWSSQLSWFLACIVAAMWLRHTSGCRGPIESAIRVYAKLCQSIMKVARCHQHASQQMGSVGIAGGTCNTQASGRAAE